MEKRRKYIKPIISEITIDNKISLIMMTGESDPPGGPWDNPNENKGSGNDDSKSKKESPFKH